MDDEKIQEILGNEELDTEAKVTAIKSLVGEGFIPRSKYNEKVEKGKEALDTLQKEFDAFKQSKMTEEEKKAEEALKKEQQLQEYSKRLSVSTAEKIFAENGLAEDDYKDVLGTIVQGTPEATEAMAKSIASLLKSQQSKLQTEFKETIKNGNPKPESGNVNGQVQTDLEKLQSEFNNASNPVDRASLLRKINELQKK